MSHAAGNKPFLLLSFYLLSINGITTYAFYSDKQRALKNQWRIPEKTLCLLGAMGGWPAGYWSMRQFRHKTKKKSFRDMFLLSTIVNIGIFGAIGHRLKGGRQLFLTQLIRDRKWPLMAESAYHKNRPIEFTQVFKHQPKLKNRNK
jgi:uncharacterized membrane protein YsdA (DUF1294 family)